ncbi:hypothetical protein [Natronobacterium gregoryi]|uniref:hypothetical protein n=1 Tax=Natronobacterium gregoryi TaxID=44930 RepID=UPI0012DD0614|nr:hypothetical protein [Natronobacterium gregoryi]
MGASVTSFIAVVDEPRRIATSNPVLAPPDDSECVTAALDDALEEDVPPATTVQ